MGENRIKPGTLCQVGIIVRDIKTAVVHYSRVLNMPEPEIILSEPLEKAHTIYNGHPTDARAKMAFFDMGQVSIELIEPVGSGPSTWREFLETHGPGIHHIAFKTDDADSVAAHLEKENLKVIQTADYPGGRYIYCDGEKTLGLIVELLQDMPA